MSVTLRRFKVTVNKASGFGSLSVWIDSEDVIYKVIQCEQEQPCFFGLTF